MSSPIKPPSSPPGRLAVGAGTEGVSPSRAGSAEAGRFSDALEQVAGAAATPAPASAHSVEGITAALRTGETSGADAIEALVRRALSAPEVAALDEAGRAALEEHLRAELASDPSLLALSRDLGAAAPGSDRD